MHELDAFQILKILKPYSISNETFYLSSLETASGASARIILLEWPSLVCYLTNGGLEATYLPNAVPPFVFLTWSIRETGTIEEFGD